MLAALGFSKGGASSASSSQRSSRGATAGGGGNQNSRSPTATSPRANNQAPSQQSFNDLEFKPPDKSQPVIAVLGDGMGSGPTFMKSPSSRSFSSSSDASNNATAAQVRAKSFAAQGAAGMYGSVGKGQGFSAGIIGSSRDNGEGNGTTLSPRSARKSKSYNHAPTSLDEPTTQAISVPVQRLMRAGSGGKRPVNGVGAAMGAGPEAYPVHHHHNNSSSSSSSQLYGSDRNLSPRAGTRVTSPTVPTIRKNSARGSSFNGGGSSTAPFGTDLTETAVTPRRFGTSKSFGTDDANGSSRGGSRSPRNLSLRQNNGSGGNMSPRTGSSAEPNVEAVVETKAMTALSVRQPVKQTLLAPWQTDPDPGSSPHGNVDHESHQSSFQQVSFRDEMPEESFSGRQESSNASTRSNCNNLAVSTKAGPSSTHVPFKPPNGASLQASPPSSLPSNLALPGRESPNSPDSWGSLDEVFEMTSEQLSNRQQTLSRNNSGSSDLSGSPIRSCNNSGNTNIKSNSNSSSISNGNNNSAADGDQSKSRSMPRSLARGQSGAETPPRAALMQAVNWHDQSRNYSGINLEAPSPARVNAMSPSAVLPEEPQQNFGLRGRKLSMEQLLGGNEDGDYYETSTQAVAPEHGSRKPVEMSRLAEAVKANDDAASRYRDLEAILTKRSLSINSNSNSSSHDTRLTSNLDWSLLNTVERRKVAEVLRLWKFAADSGLAMAARNLGAALERGAGACWAPSSSGAAALTTTALAEESQHLSDAAAWFLKAAMAGDVDAQVHLATMHTQGRGVPQSDALALKWWRSAAEQGDAQAQSKLGLFYAQGSKGVGPPLDAEAVKWWHKAAAQGHANAQFNLGLMIAQGRGGLSASSEEALKWWLLAARQGHAAAASEVAAAQQPPPRT